MKKIKIIIILIMLSTCLYTTEIMKLSEIKEGMKGEGKTIFKGTKIESFSFVVLGIMKNIFPNKSLIIVELKSPVLDEGGVISGMSGSPLYINGKIIGAVAYSLNNFSKKPIGGVTPIEDILKTSEYNTQTFSVNISDIKVDFDKKNIESILELVQKELVKRINFSPAKLLSPIKLISTNKGMNSSATTYLRPVFSSINNFNISKQINASTVDKKLFKISAADAASIPLVRGDFEYSASGTVTYVDGNKVYLFGHPYFNLGKVDFPLHKAEIMSIVPSYQSSFRLSSTKNLIGTILQDRSSGIQGVLGRVPYMIPMKVFLMNRNRNFNLEMVNHPLLTPAISYISLLNIFISEYQQYGFQSIRVKGKIFIENEKNVIINDLFSGTNSFDEFSNLVFAINFFLMNNKEKSIKIQKLDFEINGSELIKKSIIENVIVNKNLFSPGEIINIVIHLRNERGKTFMKKISLKAPSLKPGSIFYLMVADKDEMVKFDSKNTRTSYFPIKLNSLIRIINNIRKNNRIYFKLLTPTKGLFIKGYEYSNLPLSLRNVFVFNSSSNVQSDIKLSTLREYQMEISEVVQGRKLFKLRIRER